MNKSEYSHAEFLLEKIREADAVLVGAASGLSAADGRRFWYEDDEEFRKVFGPFRDKYGVRPHSMRSIIATGQKMSGGR